MDVDKGKGKMDADKGKGKAIPKFINIVDFNLLTYMR
jgi:hypothetical protein